jgi:hypothetical protein
MLAAVAVVQVAQEIRFQSAMCGGRARVMWLPDCCNDEFRHSLINLCLSAPRYILSLSDGPDEFGCPRTDFVSRKREQCRCFGKAMRPHDVSGRSKKRAARISPLWSVKR